MNNINIHLGKTIRKQKWDTHEGRRLLNFLLYLEDLPQFSTYHDRLKLLIR